MLKCPWDPPASSFYLLLELGIVVSSVTLISLQTGLALPGPRPRTILRKGRSHQFTPPQDPLSVSPMPPPSLVTFYELSPPSPTSSTETQTIVHGPPALSVHVAPSSSSCIHSPPCMREARAELLSAPQDYGGGGHSSPVSASQPLLAPSRALFYCLMLRLLPLYLFPPLVGEPLGGRGLCPLKLNSWLQAGLGQFLWKEYINDSLSVVPGPPAAALPGNLPQIQISCPSPDLLSQTPGVGLRFHKPSR